MRPQRRDLSLKFFFERFVLRFLGKFDKCERIGSTGVDFVPLARPNPCAA
jgi:hypothetical protein